MLKKRILTAVVLLPLVILAIFLLPKFWFALLTAFLIGWCAWEWSVFAKLSSSFARLLYALSVMASLSLVKVVPPVYGLLLSVSVWFWAYAAILCYANHLSTLGFGNAFFRGGAGFLFLFPFWLALNILFAKFGPGLLVFSLILVWSVDTGAYFAGRAFGKRHLIPRVSPNKTWAGLVGGVVLCVITATVYALGTHFEWSRLVSMAILALVTAVFSIVGDLLESMMKRQAGIKDSGNALPGHGGILDRLDSAIAALPIFTLGLIFLS